MSRSVRSESVVVFGALEVDLSQLDLNDHSSRVAWLRTSSIVFIVLVVTTVSLRIFARTTYVRKIFSDDGVAHSTFFLGLLLTLMQFLLSPPPSLQLHLLRHA
jgi:hypothetical protein